ncbi:MAG TPA: arsenical pump-driving ATPase [Terracidiphilus sp.]|nr:arsenical pump-driving ATPase [Terracidiphilus sp.]HEV2397996.1 arsenical pump-driving ATPase [Candidatus Sulfotelmatobacter sp.]
MIASASATRNLLFTGKGGVGKTSIACATAVSLADAGKRILLVSTDPASNLDEVLATEIGIHPTAIEGLSGLKAINIDPVMAAHEYKERVVGPYRELLPESAIMSIEEQLSGACTVEIAAFDEFAKLLGDPEVTADFDHVIFDTAPTGHTLRLLQLPTAWSDFIATNNSGTSCLGPLAGLTAQRELYERTVAALCDSGTTAVFLVSRPEMTSLAEADRTSEELRALGIKNEHLIVNGVFRASAPEDRIAAALEQRGVDALAALPTGLSALPRTDIPLVEHSLIGIPELRRFASGTNGTSSNVSAQKVELPPAVSALLPEIANPGKGVIMTMGKGGVGKTAIAAEIAVALAAMGHRVHLTTTDPAAHILQAVSEPIRNLRISRIDPVAEVEAYKSEVMEESGKGLDANGRALLEEDLRSPCTEEIAVFRAFARAIHEGDDGYVVIDTAPTGHTLLLLDAANSYHRDVERNLTYIPESVRKLLPRLRDEVYTKILIVTLAEATPVHEAAQLQGDLERAGIRPFAWIINQSLLATGTRDPILAERAVLEIRYIEEVRTKYAKRIALIPWKLDCTPGTIGAVELAQTGVNL